MKNIFAAFTLAVSILVAIGIGWMILKIPNSPQESSGTSAAYKALESDGMENIQLKGHEFLGCAKEDSLFTSYHFEAKKNDRNVSGSVCCGLLFKGCTIRY